MGKKGKNNSPRASSSGSSPRSNKGGEKIPPIPQDDANEPKLTGKKLFKFWVKFVMTVQRMFKRMPCGNAQCVILHRALLPAPQRFYSLRRHDCRCVYESLWGYFWKHYEDKQYSDPTDYLAFLMGKITDNTSCAICFEELGEDNLSKCSRKECKYFFHGHCMLSWYEKNTCPCCRAPIVLNNP